MKYMLLVYGNETSWTENERQSCMVESMKICEKLAGQGKFIASSPLQSVTTAATMRERDGSKLVTEGPFAETTEQLGGFYLLELSHLDEAIAVATSLPPVTKGTIEIRPVLAVEGLPRSQPIPTGWKQSESQPFMLICNDDEAAWNAAGEEAHQAAMNEAIALTHRLDADGQYIAASPLHGTDLATSVRVRSGKREIVDGPFAETNEVLGGFYLIQAKDRNEALQIAADHPGVRFGSVEVRPLFDLAELRMTFPS